MGGCGKQDLEVVKHIYPYTLTSLNVPEVKKDVIQRSYNILLQILEKLKNKILLWKFLD